MENFLIPTQEVVQNLKWRYATKKFDPTRKISPEIWDALEASLVLTPSSFGLQPWKFFVIDNPELRQQLVEHSWKQNQVADASHLVVFAIKLNVDGQYIDRYIAKMSEIQGVPVESLQGFGNVVKSFIENPSIDLKDWAIRQVYIALGQFMVAAAMVGVDTCPMEGFIPEKYDELLGLPAMGYGAAVLCPAGYRAEDDKYASRPKVRFDRDAMIQHIG